jgi:hypothetical protein
LRNSTVRILVAATRIPSFFDTELLQLALDAPVAPARVLLGQPQDQRDHVVGERRAPASRRAMRPLARHQPTVPAQDRVRGDEEARPAPARQRAAQCREDRAVDGAELGSLHLAAQHLELVAEHGDLNVLGVLAS